jgi:hypothetical protein
MHAWVIFLVGTVGALAPEIVRLYNLRLGKSEPITRYYLTISIIFAALGGLVAVLLPATTPWAAFYAGISTPVLINTALRQTSSRQRSELRGMPPNPQSSTDDPTKKFWRFVRAL